MLEATNRADYLHFTLASPTPGRRPRADHAAPGVDPEAELYQLRRLWLNLRHRHALHRRPLPLSWGRPSNTNAWSLDQDT